MLKVAYNKINLDSCLFYIIHVNDLKAKFKGFRATLSSYKIYNKFIIYNNISYYSFMLGISHHVQ